MKTIIYLPLIAIIALCSCKSNSFTTQRYTNYGHASHKKTVKRPEVVKATASEKEVVEVEIVKASPVTETTVKQKDQNLFCSATNSIKQTVLSFKPVRTKANVSSDVTSYSDNNVITSKSESKNISSKKSFKEKLQNARGVIGAAFETALYIVLVVIFICLIIFLLSVIF